MRTGRERTPGRHAARARFALTLLLLTLQVALAQTLYVGVGGTTTPALGADAWLRLEGVRPPAAAPATVSLELGLSPRLGVGVSTNHSFGPLGNVIFETWVALAPHPHGGAAAEGSVAARGVLGPVAVRLALLGFGAPVGTFRPTSLASAERPHINGPAAGLQTEVAYRVNRDLILEAKPELYLAGSGLALRTDIGARLLRSFGGNELRFGVHAYAPPGFGQAAAAAEAAITFPRGREPDVTVGLSVGYSPLGVWPGVRVALGQRLGVVRVDLDAALQPYRLDLPALRLTGAARVPVEGWLPTGTQLVVNAALSSGLGLGDQPGARAWAGVALALPVTLR